MAFNRNKSLAKAQKLLQKVKIADAIKEYREIVDNDPVDVRTLLKVGDLEAKLGNIESANDTCRKVAEHYAKDGFFLKSVAVFKQILKLDPGLISVYLRLAELYQQLGLNSEAMKQYQIVVRHYENQGLKKESLDVLKKMADMDPENMASRVKLAELYAREGHREASLEQFRSVADDLRKKHNAQDLARLFEKMETLGLSDPADKFELTELYLKTAEPKKALAWLQELFQADPKNAMVLELLARMFADLQQMEKAKSVYTELVSLLTEQGQALERDRVQAKLRSLGLTAAPPSVGGLPQSSAGPRAATPGESAPTAKGLAEAETLLQYGLVEKACEILERVATADPADEQARTMLVSAFEAKSDPIGLLDALERVAAAADTKALVDTAEKIRAQAATLKPQTVSQSAATAAVSESGKTPEAPPPAVAIEAPEDSLELEIVDDEAPTSEAPEVAAEPSIDLTGEFERPEGLDPGPELSTVEADSEPGLAPEIDMATAQAAPAALSEPELDLEIPEAEPASMPELVSAAEMPELEIADKPSEPASADLSFDLDVAPEEMGAPITAGETPEESSFSVDAPEAGAAPSLESPMSRLKMAEPDLSEESEPAEFEDGSDMEISQGFRRASLDADADPFATDMEEAEFFVKQGLLEEAREICRTILSQKEDYGPALEKLSEIDAAGAPAPPKATAPRIASVPKSVPTPREEVEVSAPKAIPRGTERVLREAKAAEEPEGLFDLSAELQDEINELEQELGRPKTDDEEDYLSPEEVISEFKKGVARTVAKDDYQTHYNLGIAYKEMGLLDESIHEFDLAAQDRKLATDCASMIGLCLMGKREYDTAIDVYRRALARIAPDSMEALGLSYELAEAYIGHGNLHQAYKLFARIRDADPTFRDVRRRAKELEADLGTTAPPPSAPEKKPSDKSVVEISTKKTKITYI